MLARRASKFATVAPSGCDWVDQQDLLPNPSFAGYIDPSWQVSPGGYTFTWVSVEDGAGRLARNNAPHRGDMAYNNIAVPADCAANGYLVTCDWQWWATSGASGNIIIRDQNDTILEQSGQAGDGVRTGSFDFNLNAGISELRVQLQVAQAEGGTVDHRYIYLRPTVP